MEKTMSPYAINFCESGDGQIGFVPALHLPSGRAVLICHNCATAVALEHYERLKNKKPSDDLILPPGIGLAGAESEENLR